MKQLRSTWLADQWSPFVNKLTSLTQTKSTREKACTRPWQRHQQVRDPCRSRGRRAHRPPSRAAARTAGSLRPRRRRRRLPSGWRPRPRRRPNGRSGGRRRWSSSRPPRRSSPCRGGRGTRSRRGRRRPRGAAAATPSAAAGLPPPAGGRSPSSLAASPAPAGKWWRDRGGRPRRESLDDLVWSGQASLGRARPANDPNACSSPDLVLFGRSVGSIDTDGRRREAGRLCGRPHVREMEWPPCLWAFVGEPAPVGIGPLIPSCRGLLQLGPKQSWLVQD